MQSAEHAPDIHVLETQIEQDENNLDLHFEIAAKQVVNDQYQSALRHLLVIVREDREYNDGIACKGMHAILSLLDRKDPLFKKYHQEMNRYMH